MALTLPILALIFGLALLTWSADKFIDGATATAHHLNVSPLIIGILVLGFGTSAPEIVVSIMASLDQQPELAIGNAIGSNIANIALVVGVTAMVAPLVIASGIIRKELPILLMVSLMVGWLLWDQHLTFTDGWVLLTMLGITLWLLTKNTDNNQHDSYAEELSEEVNHTPEISLQWSVVWLLFGLVLLIVSARLMVWGAVEIAEFFHVPSAIIGLTIIAIGTSLPELAAAITAALKQQADLVIGNLIGSNIFNLLAVLAMPALIIDSQIPAELLHRDFVFMLILTLVLVILCINWFKRSQGAMIGRWIGLVLFGSFIGYLIVLGMSLT